jgi:hypothetical protein
MTTSTKPLVLVHILVKDKEHTLPYYLDTVEQWSYPKDRIVLYVKTNNNQDRSSDILERWIGKVSQLYKKVIFESYDLQPPITQYTTHEWNPARQSIMRSVRTKGFITAVEEGCDYYFTSDVDNFLLPQTLDILVEADRPVIAPMLKYAYDEEEQFGPFPSNSTYSNFDVTVMDCGDTHNITGDFDPFYYAILNRQVVGLFEVGIVHCTYLIRRDVFDRVSYQNGHPEGCEYITFAYNLRVYGIPQVIDNRRVYGCLTAKEENVDYCRAYLEILKKEYV